VSFRDRLIHTLLITQTDPAASPDGTGQLFIDETGQPIGDTTSTAGTEIEWQGAIEVPGLVQEMTAKWPEGPGAGPELVDTRIYLLPDASIRELRKIRRTDIEPQQTYQAVFVMDAGGKGHHLEVRARRIPL
jgi:hypothetical protein